MKLRTIVLLLSMLVLISAAVGSYSYLSVLRSAVLDDAHRSISNHATIINDMISALLTENIRAAKVLAGTEALKSVLVSKTSLTMAAANRVLDHFNASLGVSVCYLMDETGVTIAATNRDSPKTFVGKNYGFRPYFQKAIAGTPWVYMALGVTSQARGVYYSQPVFTEGKSSPIGVVVIKAEIDDFEKKVSATYPADGGYWGVIDPHGLVFISNRTDWRRAFLWEPSAEDIREVERTRQFGLGPWEWLGFERTQAGQAKDGRGKRYLVHSENLRNKPGWRVFYMLSRQKALTVISDPLTKYRLPFFAGGGLLLCTIVLILYLMARADIERRREVSEMLHRQKTYMEALHETSLGLIGRLDFNDLISAVLTRAGELTGTRDGFLFIHDPEKNMLEMRIGIGIFKKMEGLRVKPGEGMTGTILKSREPRIVSDYAQWEGRLPNEKLDVLHTAMGIPIMSGDAVMGVMGLGRADSRHTFSDVDLEMLMRFGELASIVFDNAKLYTRLQEELSERQRAQRALKSANKELKRLSVIDSLTQIANRRFFDQRLEDECRRSARTRRPLSLLMCDADFFKAYNDTYGHKAGDDCLKKIARALTTTTHRPGDTVARYGGEEFAVILGSTDEKGAMAVAEKIRGEVINLHIPHAASDISDRVTLSIGVATAESIDHWEECPVNLLEAADKALYQAKSGGRNRISTYSDCMPDR